MTRHRADRPISLPEGVTRGRSIAAVGYAAAGLLPMDRNNSSRLIMAGSAIWPEVRNVVKQFPNVPCIK